MKSIMATSILALLIGWSSMGETTSVSISALRTERGEFSSQPHSPEKSTWKCILNDLGSIRLVDDVLVNGRKYRMEAYDPNRDGIPDFIMLYRYTETGLYPFPIVYYKFEGGKLHVFFDGQGNGKCSDITEVSQPERFDWDNEGPFAPRPSSFGNMGQ